MPFRPPGNFDRPPAVPARRKTRNSRGNIMSNRSWFYASNGQQQGPLVEDQLRDLIARGAVRADTLVWSEGMAGWQKAGEIPGLMSMPPGPPSISQGSGPPVMGGGYGGAVSADLPVWSLLGDSLVYVIGIALVIPAPWAATWF